MAPHILHFSLITSHFSFAQIAPENSPFAEPVPKWEWLCGSAPHPQMQKDKRQAQNAKWPPPAPSHLGALLLQQKAGDRLVDPGALEMRASSIGSFGRAAACRSFSIRTKSSLSRCVSSFSFHGHPFQPIAKVRFDVPFRRRGVSVSQQRDVFFVRIARAFADPVRDGLLFAVQPG